MHRREDITPGIREGYRCVYRIGGVVRSGEIVVRPRETPLHFNTTPTSSAQSNDDDVANESQDLVGDGGRVLEIEAPLSLPPPQELSLDEILSTLDSGSSLSTQLDSGYGIAIASPSTNVNSARLSDSSSSNSSSNYGMALGGICLVPLVVMFLQFVKNVIVGRLSSRTRTNDSPSRLNLFGNVPWQLIQLLYLKGRMKLFMFPTTLITSPLLDFVPSKPMNAKTNSAH